MATYSFHSLIMRKLEIDNFCRVNGDICIFFTEMFIECLQRFIQHMSKSLNLIKRLVKLCFFYCRATDTCILKKLSQQCFLFFIVVDIPGK